MEVLHAWSRLVPVLLVMTMMVLMITMMVLVMTMMVVAIIIHDGDVGDIPSNKGDDKKIEPWQKEKMNDLSPGSKGLLNGVSLWQDGEEVLFKNRPELKKSRLLFATT